MKGINAQVGLWHYWRENWCSLWQFRCEMPPMFVWTLSPPTFMALYWKTLEPLGDGAWMEGMVLRHESWGSNLIWFPECQGHEVSGPSSHIHEVTRPLPSMKWGVVSTEPRVFFSCQIFCSSHKKANTPRKLAINCDFTSRHLSDKYPYICEILCKKWKPLCFYKSEWLEGKLKDHQ